MTPSISAREAVIRDLDHQQAELQRGIESAARSGTDSTRLRAKLTENAAKLAEARAELQAAQDVERQQGTNASRVAGDSLTDAAIARVAGAAERFVFGPVPAPEFTDAPALAAVSHNVAAARMSLADAEADHASAQGDADELAGKLSAKRARHASLLQERASTGSEGGAAEMYALAQDVETLAAMHQRAKAHADSLMPAVNAARVALNSAQTQAAKVESRLRAEHLAVHARRLDEAYIACLRSIQEAGARAGASAGSLVATSLELRSWVTAGIIPRQFGPH